MLVNVLGEAGRPNWGDEVFFDQGERSPFERMKSRIPVSLMRTDPS